MKLVRLFIALLLLMSISSFAQDRQKVGVVLSGGGARGLAHLGALKALEEAQVPIDYIAGTSMGAIIGGMYASGYSIKEIEKIFFSEEFQKWLTGKIDEKYIYFYKQKTDNSAFVSFNFDPKEKLRIQLPTSIVDPVQMDYAFMEIFANSSAISKNNFDSLFVPFLCIASDIDKNAASVRRKGDLGKAIRASMTFPFYFSPITLDGKIMFDGGMYNNFPSKEMLEIFNPDFIIGVRVVGNYPPPKEGDIMSYLQNIFMNNIDYDIFCENGVMIAPDLGTVGVMDFSKMRHNMFVGYEAALEKIGLIREYMYDTVSVEQVNIKRKEFLEKQPPIKIKKFSVKGAEKGQTDYLSKTLFYNIDKKELPLDILKEKYFALYSDYNIRRISPSLRYDDSINGYDLRLNVKVKEYLTAKIGGCFSTNPITHLFLGLDYNVLNSRSWLFQTNMYAGRYYTSFMAKARTDYPGRILPIYSELELNANNWNFYKLKTNFFDYSPMNYMVQSEFNIQFRFGFPTSMKDKVAFNVGYGSTNDDYFNIRDISAYDTTDNTKFTNFVAGFSRIYSTLDAPQLAVSGMFSKISIQYVNGVEKFTPGNTSSLDEYNTQRHSWMQFSVRHLQYLDLFKHYSLGVSADVFFSLQKLFSSYTSTLLHAGAYTPTLETLTQFMPEYRANQYFAAGIENVFKVDLFGSLKTSIRLGGYVYAPFRRIFSSSNIPYYGEFFDKYYFILNSAVVVRTPVGPLNFIVSYHQRDNKIDNPFAISLSFGYVLFNKKNIDK